MSVRKYDKIPEWKWSIHLVESVYRLSRRLPDDEKSMLSATLRRTATSIPARIADGYGRNDPAAFPKAVCDALGALRELQTHVIVARRLGYVSRLRTSLVDWRIRRLTRMLEDLSASLGQCRVDAFEPRRGADTKTSLRPVA